MASNSVYREKSLERISSPEKLDDYIKVSNPSVWIILLALTVLIAGFFYWGFFGSLPTTINGSGLAETDTIKAENAVTCFVSQEDYDKLKTLKSEGKDYSNLTVNVKPRNSADGKEFSGKIIEVGDSALDKEAISNITHSDAITSLVTPSDGFGVRVTVTVSEATLAKNSICDVTIVVQENTPKDFLFS